jgi:hypothetical protein
LFTAGGGPKIAAALHFSSTVATIITFRHRNLIEFRLDIQYQRK